MKTEIWRDVQWYEEEYKVSNLWKVQSIQRIIKHSDWHYQGIKWRILKPIIWKNLHSSISFWRGKRVYIHRLVAQAFLWLEINDTKMLVCHIDDNPLNNRVDNLFLWSCKDNIHDCIKKWRNAVKFKTNHYFLMEEDVTFIRNSIWLLQQKELAKMFNTDQSHISRIQNNLVRKNW